MGTLSWKRIYIISALCGPKLRLETEYWPILKSQLPSFPKLSIISQLPPKLKERGGQQTSTFISFGPEAMCNDTCFLYFLHHYLHRPRNDIAPESKSNLCPSSLLTTVKFWYIYKTKGSSVKKGMILDFSLLPLLHSYYLSTQNFS